jgi:hypothetical protein
MRESFPSDLFGGNTQHKSLREALSRIQRMLEDEEFQLEHIHPAMRDVIIESSVIHDNR